MQNTSTDQRLAICGFSANLWLGVTVICVVLALPAAQVVAEWTECIVDAEHDGAGCSTAFSPVTHLPSVAYTGRVSAGGPYGLYYAQNEQGCIWDTHGPLDNVEYDGRDTSLAFSPGTGQPGIAYRSEFGQILYVQRDASGAWQAPEVINIGGDNSNGVSLAFSPTTGEKAIAYHKAWGSDVILHWYAPPGGWVDDVVGAGIWDKGTPSVGFSILGVPAVSYYDGGWGLSCSRYDPVNHVWLAEQIEGAGGGRSSLSFSPVTDEPCVASIGYVIGGTGEVQFSYYDNGNWVRLDSGMLGNDELNIGISLAFDDQNRPRIAFNSGAVTLLAAIDNYLDPPSAVWTFESPLLHQGSGRAYLAIDGPRMGIAVSASDGLRFVRPPAVPGDCDQDGDVDLDDFASFAACVQGPGGGLGLGCGCFDFDDSGDVDLADFAAFQTAFTGPLP